MGRAEMETAAPSWVSLQDAQMRWLLQAAPDATAVVNGDGQIVSMNTQLELLFRCPGAELVGRSIDLLVPGRFRGAHPSHRRDYAGDPRPRPMGTGRDLYALRADGTEFLAEISLSSLDAPNGRLVTVAVRDISERRKADEARFQLAAIVESSDDAIVGATMEGSITSWNRAAEEIFGYTKDEAIGQPLSMLPSPGAEGEMDAMLARILRGERVEHHDARRRRRDGRDLDVSISMSAIQDQYGALIGVSEVMRDVTVRKKSAAALVEAKDATESASLAFEAFSYSVAHDLRAPLRAIDGFSAALAKEYSPVLDEIGLDYLNRIRTSAQAMAQLIDSLLTLARVTHRELTTTTVDLSALASATLAGLKEGEPSREVETIIQPDLRTRGDVTLLHDALGNLLANAWKFTRDQPQARIEFGHDHAGYFIRDNGAGFDMAFSAKLFGVFQRLHSPQDFEGTGIGLATVHRIIDKHGGKIWAEGIPHHGATFHFTLGRDNEER